MTDSLKIRPARTSDVAAIKKLVAPLADQRILMAKETVAYYESLQEFRIAEAADGEVVGCGALHVMWEDLAEVRTLAASDSWRGQGVGHVLVESLVEEARALGVARVFCLTFEGTSLSAMASRSWRIRRLWTLKFILNFCAPMTKEWPNSLTWRV